MRTDVYSMFITSLKEKIATFIFFNFHNYKVLQCCDQNHNDNSNQLTYNLMRIHWRGTLLGNAIA